MTRIENNIRVRPAFHERALRKVGFASRDRIIDNLNRIYTGGLQASDRADLIINDLVEKGILKSSVLQRHENRQINEFEDFRSFIKLTATPSDIRSSNIGFDEGFVFGERNLTLYKMASIARNLIASGSLLAGKVVYWALGATALYGIGDIMMSDNVALLTGGATILTYLGYRFSDRIHPNTILHTLSIAAKKALPFSAAAGFGYLTYLFNQADTQVSDLSRCFGTWGTAGMVSGLAWLTLNYLVRELRGLNLSRGGQVNPGSPGGMKTQSAAAAIATVSEVEYLTARLMMLISSIYYVGKNTGDGSKTALIPLAIPLISFFTTWLMRKSGTEMSEPSVWTNFKRHLKIYTPLWGLGAGLATAAGLSYSSGQWNIMQSYAVTWFSMLYLFVSEFHSSGHSANSGLGFLRGLKTSSVPVISDEKIYQLTRKVISLFKRADTGIKESSLGLVFNMLNGMSGQPTFSFYDRPMNIGGHAAEFKKRESFVADEIGGLEREIFSRLHDRVAQQIARRGNLEERYLILIEDLEKLAQYYNTELIPRLEAEFLSASKAKVGTAGSTAAKLFPSAAFDEVEREYIRANLDRLQLVADGFHARAQRLRQKLAKDQVSATDFQREWEEPLSDYDFEFNGITPVARKVFAGDCLDIQKGQNVNTLDLFRSSHIHLLEKTDWKGGGDPPTYIVAGTYSRIKNPKFKYGAEKGTLAAAKYVWVETEKLLFDLQKEESSTAPDLKQVDNDPSANAGFVKGTASLDIEVNGTIQPFQEYYYFTGEGNPDPSVRKYIYRDGTTTTALPAKYKFRRAINVPAWDYYTIADKNDVIFHVKRALAALEEAKRLNEVYAQIVYRIPWGSADISDLVVKNADVIDADMSLEYEGRLIPYQLERDSVRDFIAKPAKRFVESLPLRQARITRKDGEAYTSLIHEGIAPAASAHLTRRLENLLEDALYSQGDNVTLELKIRKENGKISSVSVSNNNTVLPIDEFISSELSIMETLNKVNLADGEEAIIPLIIHVDPKKQEVKGYSLQIYGRPVKFKQLAERVEYAMPDETYTPKYLSLLELPADRPEILVDASNFFGITGFAWFIKYKENDKAAFMLGKGDRMTWRDQLSKARGH